jgi:phytanoyl-CoA hydroxylase
MWFDELGQASQLSASLQTNPHKEHILNLHNRGYTIIRGAVGESYCAKAIDAFEVFLKGQPEHERQRRFQNAHLVIPEVLQVATSRTITDVLESVFRESPALWSSLYFKFGSQQATHVDGPYFATSPESTFLGVWTALEMVKVDAGPLFYFEAGHTAFIDPISTAREWADRYAASAFWDEPDWWSLYNFKSDARFDVSLWNWYQARIEANCLAAGLNRQAAILDPGDTLVWHPRLPHGGSVIESQGLTRQSLVSHWVPASARVGGPDVFHGIRNNYLITPCVTMGSTSSLVFQQGYGFGG